MKPRTSLSLIIAILFLTGIVSCSLSSTNDSQEIKDLPGGFTLTEGTSSVVDLYNVATDYVSHSEFAEAEAIYRQIIEIEPENHNGYIGLGSSLIYQNKLSEAQDAYSQALALSPKSTMALIGLGSVAHQNLEYESAIAYYCSAVELNDQLAQAHWGLAITLEDMGRFEEAIEHLEQFLLLASDSQLADLANDRLSSLKFQTQ